jgi:hypothetical protein
LTRDFCDVTVFCRGKLIPRHCRFLSGLNLKHQLSQTVIILRKTSRFLSTILMKLRQHSTLLSLSVQLLRESVQTSKEIFILWKTLSRICLDVPFRLENVKRIVWRLFVCHAIKWFEFSPRIHCTVRKLVGLDKEHPPAIPFLLKNAWTIARYTRLRHSSSYTCFMS